MYTEYILISSLTANIEGRFIQMQCASEALKCTFKSFYLIINSCTSLNIYFVSSKVNDMSSQSRTLRLGCQMSYTEFIKSRLRSVN